MKVFAVKRVLSHSLALVFFVSTTLNIAACGSKGGSSSAGLNNGTSQTPLTPIQQDWANVDTQAFISGGPFNKIQVVSVNQNTNTLTIEIPLSSNPSGATVMSPIPELPGATAGLQQDSNTGQWYFAVSIPLTDLVKGVNWSPPTALPNGSPLPAVPGGTLPTIASKITVNGTNVSFYFYGSPNYFGIFFPTPWFNPYIQLQWPVMNASQTNILGYFDTIPNSSATSGNDGGFWFAMDYSPAFQQLINDLANLH